MDAILHAATLLTKKFDFLLRNERQIALVVHRAARDCFTTINLALIHPKVAKANFFGGKRGGNKCTQLEANANATANATASATANDLQQWRVVCIGIH